MHYLISKLKQMLPLMLFMFPAMAFAAPEGPPEGASLHFSTTNTTTNQCPRFEPNRGQLADTEGNLLPHIKYVYRAPGMTMGLTKNGFIYNVYTVENQEKEPAEEPGLTAAIEPANPRHEEPQEVTYHYHRVEVEFLGANPNPQILAEEQTSDYANYYLGHCPQGITGVYGYQKLIYKDLYPNIDLVLKRQQTAAGTEELKYDIIVHPGGNLSQVKMQYNGMDGLALEDGKLQLTTSQGTLTESIPASYWKESGAAVEVSYQLQDEVVSFAASKQHTGQTLVVDPSLIWSTYLGGSNWDRSEAVTIDGSGNAFITGYTMSTNFPTSGAYQGSYGGGIYDAFLSKFTPTGTLSWSTYLGGNSHDFGNEVATDDSGNAFVTGLSLSTNFPTTTGAYQDSHIGDLDVILSRFTPTGSLSWSTYLGGSQREISQGVATDGSGNVFVTGLTESLNFPTTSGAYQGNFAGGNGDVFLSKFTPTGSLSWSTYLGGSGEDDGVDVAIDGSGNAFVLGSTESTNFPTSGAYQSSYAGDWDAFLVKFSPTGTLSWSSYFGGSGEDDGTAVAIDVYGNAFITGHTMSTNFPTSNAYQGSIAGDFDAFLSKFTSTGTLSWSTYLGGSNSDRGQGIVIDDSGNAFITGGTESLNFPTTRGAYQASHAGGSSDAFLSKFTTADSLSWSSYLGGSNYDFGNDVAIDSSGNVFVTGLTESLNFPTSGAYQGSHGGVEGSRDAFLSKFAFSAPAPEITVKGTDQEINDGQATTSTTSGTDFGTTAPCTPRTNSFWVLNTGNDTLFLTAASVSGSSAFAISSFSSDPVSAGDSALLEVSFNPTQPGQEHAEIVVVSNDIDEDTFTFAVTGEAVNPPATALTVEACNSYTSPSGSYTWTTSGTYMDTLTNIRGCDSLITVHLTVEAVDTSVTKSGGILTALAPNASYQWLDCNSGFATISGANSQSFTPGADGNYAVEVTQNGCTDTSTCYPVTIVGLEDQDWDLKPTIVPNPTTGKVTLQLSQPYEEVTVTVCNALGAVIKEHHFFHRTAEVAFHLEGVPGIYFLRITTPAGHTGVVKVVKE